MADGIRITATTDTATTDGVDVSDAEIVNAINVGGNTILGTAAVIDFSEFDVSGTTGTVTINDGGDAGALLVEGTNLDINSLDFVGAGSISTAAGNDLTINSGTTGTINIGTDASAETINIGNTGAAVKTIAIGNSAQANLVTIGSTSGAASLTLQGGTADINFSSGDDYLFTNAAGSQLVYTEAASTITTGVWDLNLDTSVTGGFSTINNGLTVNNGAATGDDYFAEDVVLTNNDADANAFGLRITGSATANAGANAYEAGIIIDNAENTAGSMADGIRITATTDTATTDGVDVSDAEIVNAINVGGNTILGTAAVIDFSEFDVSGTTGTVTINDGGDAGALLVEGTNLDINSLDFVGAGLVTTGSNTSLTLTPGGTGDTIVSVDADTNLQITASAAPAVDMVAITNSGQAVTTAGVEGLSINYTGGAAAVESAGARIDLTPGSTAEGTWSGLRIVANATGPVAKVVENGIKLEGPTSITDGGIANAIDISNSKWTAALNINEAKVALNTPFGGIGKFENYLKRAEQFDQSDWSVETSGVTVAADNTTAPDGTTTAEKLTDNATAGTRISQSATASNSETWTFSVWVKNNDATGTFELELHDNSLAGASDTKSVTIASPATDSWRRYSITHATAGSGVTSIVPAIDVNQSGGATSIYVWGAQLEKQTSPGVYHRTIATALTNSGSEGLVVDSNLNNTTASGNVYGARFVDYIISSTAGTHDAVFIRNQDDTSLTGSTHVVRGLQVQAWNGSNTNGTNIGVDAYGKTFGISGTTDALAGAQSTPAAVFAYLQNTSATSTGNAIRAYSDKATGATLVSIYHETSAFTGTGLAMDIGNGSGSFASGNFLSLKNAGSQKAHFDSGGNAYVTLASANTFALCHATNGAQTDEKITDCSGSVSADYAEMYPVEHGVNYGDVVTIGSNDVVTNDGGLNIKQLVKSSTAYDKNVVGIVSNNYGDFSSTGYVIDDVDNPMPVALNGRIPVRFSNENGDVAPGDFLAASGTVPGAAMKATQPGWVIGQALNNPSGGQVMTFVRGFYYDPTVLVDAKGNVNMQNTGTMIINSTTTDNLLQVQSNGVDKLLVKNNGELNINVTPVNNTDNLLVVRSNDSEVFSINARGQVAFAGNIIVKDDSFAGSISTDENGEADIDFTYDLGTGKPDVQLTVEGDTPAFAQISSFERDANNNYIGFKIKTFSTIGSPVSVVVHYLVVGKQADYDTNGVVIQVISTPPSSTPPPSSNTISGCTDSNATNYDASATVDDGSCVIDNSSSAPPPSSNTISGCTDSNATNYDASATVDDGSCVAPSQLPPSTPDPDTTVQPTP